MCGPEGWAEAVVLRTENCVSATQALVSKSVADVLTFGIGLFCRAKCSQQSDWFNSAVRSAVGLDLSVLPMNHPQF